MSFIESIPSLIDSAESCLSSMSELFESGADAVAAELEQAVQDLLPGTSDLPCCRLAGRVTSTNAALLNDIVELALSEEFRKYCSKLVS